jgi:DNA mismatch endonuclease, patch repair protein
MMVDRLSSERRSWNMSRIRGKDTGPERRLRSMLHRAGFRFRLHDRKLPGRPDIVLGKYRSVVFVHGCYWHRHEGCPRATTPSTRTDFWLNKFAATVERDKRKTAELENMGWRVITVWECELESDPEAVLDDLCRQLMNGGA